MPNDRLPDDEPDMLDKLFGDPADLSDEDLDLLYDAVAPGEEPPAAIHRIAEEAAVAYRKRNQVPPDHVQAALDATRQIKSLEEASPSKLCQIVDKLKNPIRGPVYDPAYSYRNLSGDLNDTDQAIIDELTEELKEDWEEESDE
jgi:hypothetical protein